jgi:hypothetical protein
VRFRKLIGAVALFVLVLAWALIAMAVAQFPAIRDTTVLSILYYVIAGCGLGVCRQCRRLLIPPTSTESLSGYLKLEKLFGCYPHGLAGIGPFFGVGLG